MLNQFDKDTLIRLIDERLYDLEQFNVPLDSPACVYLYELMDKVDLLNVPA